MGLILWYKLELQNGLAIDGPLHADTQNMPPWVIRVMPMKRGELESGCARW